MRGALGLVGDGRVRLRDFGSNLIIFLDKGTLIFLRKMKVGFDQSFCKLVRVSPSSFHHEPDLVHILK